MQIDNSQNGVSSHGNGKILNGVQNKMSQLNLTRLSSISGTYSMFSNESTESLNTMGSVGTPTTIESNSTTNVTPTLASSRMGDSNSSSLINIRKSASSSFSNSSGSGNTIGSPSTKVHADEDNKSERDGSMTRDLRSVPNLSDFLKKPSYEKLASEDQLSTNCDSIELLNFADANEIQVEADVDNNEVSGTNGFASASTRAVIENKENLQDPIQIDSTNGQHPPTRSDSSYTFQSYDCSSRSSTISSAAQKADTNKPANHALSRPLRAINSKSAKSKASCSSTSGLLSKNGSQVKLIDLEDEEDDDIGYPLAYFNSTDDDLNDISSLSGYESMEGGTTHYDTSASTNLHKPSEVHVNKKSAKPSSLIGKHLPSTNDSRKTIGCASRMSFANPHYLCADVKNILEKTNGGACAGRKMSQVSSVFGERMLGIVRDELSHENFAQALNSPAESLISDYNDFHARLNHDLVELKGGENNEIVFSQSSNKNVKSPTGDSTLDYASSHYYQTVEDELQDAAKFHDPNHVQLVQLRTKPSKTIHTPSMTPQLGRKMGQNNTSTKSSRPLSTGSLLSSNSSSTGLQNTSSAMGTLRRRLPQQPIYEDRNLQSHNNDLQPEDRRFGNVQNTANRNQLKLLMYIIGGREIGQATLFKRPISMWKLDLTKTF